MNNYKTTELSETLILSERVDGFWLYDDTRGVTLVLRAKSPQEALLKTIKYYQDRLIKIEHAYKDLKKFIDKFVIEIEEEETDE